MRQYGKQIGTKFNIYEETINGMGGNNYVDKNFLMFHNPFAKDVQDITGSMADYVSSIMPSLSANASVITDFLMKTGRTVSVRTNEVGWKLKAEGYQSCISEINLEPNTQFPGIDGCEFSLSLNCDHYRVGTHLAPCSFQRWQVLVQSDPILTGTTYTYKVVLISSDPHDYFPPELLEPGMRWKQVGGSFGEASSDYIGFEASKSESFIEFRVPLNKYRIGFKVTDEAGELNLIAEKCTKDDYKVKGSYDQVYPKYLAKMQRQAATDKEMMLLYSKGSFGTIVDQSSGYERLSGPGIYEYLEDGYVFEYNPDVDGIDMLKDFLDQMFYDRVPRSQRHVQIYGGEKAFCWFTEAIEDKLGYIPYPTGRSGDVPNIRKGGHNPFPDNGMTPLEGPSSFYAKYNFKTGGSVTFHHLPILDSRDINGGLEYDGYPATSWEMIVLDYGIGRGADSNIIYVEREGSKEFATVCGMYTPAGRISNGKSLAGFTPSHTGQYYEVVMGEQFGVVIKDTSRTVLIRPDFSGSSKSISIR